MDGGIALLFTENPGETIPHYLKSMVLRRCSRRTVKHEKLAGSWTEGIRTLNRHEISGILLLSLGLISLACLYGCDASQSKTKAGGASEKLVICTHSGDYSALFRIAEKQG